MTLRSGSHYKGLTAQPEQTETPATHLAQEDTVNPDCEPRESQDSCSHDEPSQLEPSQPVPSEPEPEISQPERPLHQDDTTEQPPPVHSTRAKKRAEEAEFSKYAPPAPFPRRLLRYKIDQEFQKFVDMLKQLEVTIPFTQVIAQVPKYAKFLKDVISNKRLLGGDYGPVKLTEQCSAVLTRIPNQQMPPKLDDPGKFTVPCTIGKACIKRALCDLGASVSLMPRSVYDRIGVGDLRPTRMTLQLADSSTRLPLGILEDVPIQLGKFYIPGDFVVIEMEEDREVPIILGRPFLSTARALIDARDGTLVFMIGGEKVSFSIDDAMRCPTYSLDTCYMIEDITTDEELPTPE